MKMREIGNTGMMASAMAIGTWAVGGDTAWGASDDNLSIKAIHTALDYGVNLIDTAPAYGFGHSEEVVGKAIKGIRDKVLISTKCGLNFDGVGSLHVERDGRRICRNLSKEEVMRGAEESLRRLNTDYIDIFITHWQSCEPFLTPISETMEALLRLKEQGKIRAIAISNATVAQLEEYRAMGDVALVQEKYSMLSRKVESEMLPFCEANKITLQAYSPLEQGLLTGRFTMDTQLPAGDIRSKTVFYQPENRQKVLAMLDSWKPYLEQYDCSIAELVIAWTAAQGNGVNVICGARKPEHVLANRKGGEITLAPEVLAAMRRDIEALGF